MVVLLSCDVSENWAVCHRKLIPNGVATLALGFVQVRSPAQSCLPLCERSLDCVSFFPNGLQLLEPIGLLAFWMTEVGKDEGSIKA